MPWQAANNRYASRAQLPLRVSSLEKLDLKRDVQLGTGLIDVGSFKEMTQNDAAALYVFARTSPKCVLKVMSEESLSERTIAMDAAQRLNFEVVPSEGVDETFQWSSFTSQEFEALPSLSDVVFDVKVMDEAGAKEKVIVDRENLRKEVCKGLWKLVVTLHERIFVNMNDTSGCERKLMIRVSEVQAEAVHTDESTDLFIPDCHMGVMESYTKVFFSSHPSEVLELRGEAPAFKPRPYANVCNVYCRDGEWFPVKKRLLQPCLKLAQKVLSDELEEVHVDIDCCAFDKVLRYLEAEKKSLSFDVDLHDADELLQASKDLRLIGLQRICEKVQENHSSAIRNEGIPLNEVFERNSNGGILIVIDNLVFDATDWLMFHPGGNFIIPEKALNVDATVLFETYHASRESFLFLKQLYTGPLKKEDRCKLPQPEHEIGLRSTPSEPFLQQLRDFFVEVKTFKSF